MRRRSARLRAERRDTLPAHLPQYRRKLFVPIGEIARLLTGKRTLKRFGVEYITDSKGVLSYDVAYLIRQLLGADKKTGPLDWLEVEKKLTGRLMNEK